MATAGPNSPASGTTDGGAGVAWSSPGNIVSSNNADASATSIPTGTDTEHLRATQFGFAIPTDATINGITVEIEASDAGTSFDGALSHVQLTKDGTNRVGSDLESGTQAVTTTDTYYTYGDGANLWGTTWTPAEVNDTSFGVHVRGRGIEAGDAGSVRVDHIRITITYTEAATGIATKLYQYRLRRAA